MQEVLRSLAQEAINEYECTNYKVVVKAQMQQRKKVHNNLDLNYDEYFKPQSEEEAKTLRVAVDVKKTIESSIWLSNEFPLKIQNFLTVLKTLPLGGNTNMTKMKEFLKNQSLKEVITSHCFPLKIQMPVGFLIKATVDFNKF